MYFGFELSEGACVDRESYRESDINGLKECERCEREESMGGRGSIMVWIKAWS